MNNETNIRLFKQIAEGFNLTEGEVAQTIQLPSQGLVNAIKDCFRQIEQPRTKFTPEDYTYLTDELGCVNLEEQLENAPLDEVRSLQEQIIATIFDLPIKFTESELLTQLYLDGYADVNATVSYTLELLSNKKVKYLIKDGGHYSLNLEARIG